MHSSRPDQSAYITYLVDEALKESENRSPPSVSPSSGANSQSSAPYPVALNFQLNSVPISIPLVTNSSLQPVHSQQLHQPNQPVGYWVPTNSDVTANQGLVPGLQQYSTRNVIPTSGSTNCSLPLQGTQTYSSVSRYQPDSFRLSQHIGLSEQPVENVSQINNKIQVQFQFGDDDRFIVQSRKTDSSTVGLNCQSLDNSGTRSSSSSEVPSQQLPGRSNYTLPGDLRQFLVENILGKNSDSVSAPSSTSEFGNQNVADHACNSEYVLQNERNCVTVLDISERWRNELTRCKTKNSNCRNKEPRCSIKSIETVKEFLKRRRGPTGTETKAEEIVSELGQVADKEVQTLLVADKEVQTPLDDESTLGLPWTIEDVVQDISTDSKQQFDTEFVRQELHIESVKQDCETESVERDFHAESRAYFKEFLELVERQKAEKQKEFIDKRGNKCLSRKEQLPTAIKPQVNYECGICSEPFASTEQFEHHVTVNHSVEDVIQTIHKESKQHFDKEFVKQELQSESVKPDFHGESRAYFKEFLELVERQKAEKQKAFIDKRGNKRLSRKKQLPTVNKKLQVNYECKICSEPFASNIEFEHHMIVNHYDENIEYSTVDNLTVKAFAKTMEERSNTEECDRNLSNNITVEESDIEDDTGSCLCTYCGLDCKTKIELDVHHQEVHGDEVEDGVERQVQHVEEREYLEQSRQLLEAQKKRKIVQQREQQERQAAEQGETKIVEKISKTKNGKRPGPRCSKRKHQEASDEVIESLPKRQAATQAKNNLMNPSKGKQKRVRNTANLDKEDEMLMKMFGIIPSKVCLSRVNEIETERNRSEDKTGEKTRSDENNSTNICSITNSGDSKVTCAGNEDKIFRSEDALFSDDDSDLEIIEKPVELIVLDDEDSPEKTEGSPTKVDADVPLQSIGAKENYINKSGCKSDAELMAQFGIKDISVKLTNSPVKSKVKCKMGPKYKTQKQSKDPNVNLASSVTVPTKNINDMTPEEIAEMLKFCGMAISIPVCSSSDVKEKSSSPKPSTSKGYGHLRRKKTARKSTQDSALIKKYKLKDSKVILKSLTKIEISMLRNPNSSFGKTNWLKHKFDSDTESDFEFDIPTPPEMEEFIDDIAQSSNLSKQSTVKSSDHISESRIGRVSPVKRQDLKLMEKFGLSEAKVVINSPKKDTSSGKNSKGKISDAELLKKFGIPSTMVVIDSSSGIQTSSNLAKPNVNSQEFIKFSDFKIALDTATKNILCKLKGDSDTDKSVKVICNEPNSRANVRRKLDVNESKSQPLAKKMKTTEAKYMQQKKMKNTKNLNDKKKVFSDTGKENVQNCVSVASGENMGSTNHKILRPKLAKEKTRQGKLRQSKSNVALNSFKAKAVTRAIENRIKQTRHRQETQNKNQLESCQKNIRQKNISGRQSVAEISKSKHKNSSGESIKQQKQVVKTARYRRSDAQKKVTLKSELEELTKGLPELKVSVECLTENEIIKLKKSINSNDTVDSEEADMPSEKLVNIILDNLIDQVCGHSSSASSLVPSQEIFSSINSVAENLNEDELCKLKKAKEKNLKNIQNDKLVQSDAGNGAERIELNETESELNNRLMNSCKQQSRGVLRIDKEEKVDEKIDDDNESEMLNCKEKSGDKTVTYNQESDISLISECSELEGSNDEVNMSEVNIQAEAEVLNKQSENVDEDKVPLPKSKFYGEDKENILDDVDDESNEDDAASEEMISTALRNESKKDGNSDSKNNEFNETLENDNKKEVAVDNCNESLHKTGAENDKNNEKLTDSIETDECHDPLKEKAMSDISHRTEYLFSCLKDVSDHKEGYDLNENDSIDSGNIEKGNQNVLKKSASIIDKNSGDMIGEYYDVGESLKGMTGPYNNDQLKIVEKVKDNIAPIQSRSTTPDDVIETLSEN